MKNIIKISRWTLLLGALLLVAASCNKSEDLLTADAKTGGLVVPVTTNVAYKLANTPQVDITLDIPVGPTITSIKVYNSFFAAAEGVTSAEVFMKEVPVTGSEVAFSVNYSELKSGITIDGNPLPDDETQLSIGSSWKLVYHSILSDGREVVNNSRNTTTIGVANIYAGSYHVTGTFNHPTAGIRDIDEDKYLTAIGAYQVTSTMGDLGPDYPTIITVNPTDNSCVVTSGDGNPYDVQMTVGTPSFYDPVAGTFSLHYFYVGSTGPRIIDELYTPNP